MADIQHKNITDPNLHEPKGVKFADANTAYIADGTGSGSWEPVLFPSDIASTRYQIFKFTGKNNTVINNTLFPLTYTEEEKVGDALVTASSNMITFAEEGVYYISYILNMNVDNKSAYGTATSNLNLTSSSSTYTSFSPFFVTFTASWSRSQYQKPGGDAGQYFTSTSDNRLVNGRNILFKDVTSGSKMGLWATGNNFGGSGIWKTNVSGYVQIVKV